mgnify:CR=1 FL=1
MRKKFNFVHSMGDGHRIVVRPCCETYDWTTNYLRVVLKGIDPSDDYLFDKSTRVTGRVCNGLSMESWGIYGYDGTFCYRRRRVDGDLYLEFSACHISLFDNVSAKLNKYQDSISCVGYTLEGFTKEGVSLLTSKYKFQYRCNKFNALTTLDNVYGSGLYILKSTGCGYGVDPPRVSPSDLGLVSNPSNRSYTCTFDLVKK